MISQQEQEQEQQMHSYDRHVPRGQKSNFVQKFA